MFRIALFADNRAAVKLVVPARITLAEVVFTSRSPVIATLESVPPLVVATRAAPEEKVQAPPEIVPPVNWMFRDVLTV